MLVLVGVRKPVFHCQRPAIYLMICWLRTRQSGTQKVERKRTLASGGLELSLRTTDHAVVCFPIPNLVPFDFGITWYPLARPYGLSRFLV